MKTGRDTIRENGKFKVFATSTRKLSMGLVMDAEMYLREIGTEETAVDKTYSGTFELVLPNSKINSKKY